MVYPPIWQDGHNTNIDKVTQREKVVAMATVNKTRNLETELTGTERGKYLSIQIVID